MRWTRASCLIEPGTAISASAVLDALAVGLALAVGVPAVAEEAPAEPRYLSPAELIEIAEASELTYEIRLRPDIESVAPDGLAAALWPSMGAGLDHPFVEAAADGSRQLVVYPLAEGCLAKLEAGDVPFHQGDYAAAAEVFGAAVEAYPNCYQAHLHFGDTVWHRGDAEKALLHYERAVALNPFAVQAQYFRANALLKLGRRDDAYQGYVKALALRPHRSSLEQMLAVFAGRVGASYDAWRLEPRALVEPIDHGIAITVDPAQPAWALYGQCRAIWLVEPGFRRPEGDNEPLWNNSTEINCLRAALQAYENGRANAAAPVDPTLERLQQVYDAGLLHGMVFYEVGGRINPDILLLLPDEVRASVIAYIERFVLVRQ